MKFLSYIFIYLLSLQTTIYVLSLGMGLKKGKKSLLKMLCYLVDSVQKTFTRISEIIPNFKVISIYYYKYSVIFGIEMEAYPFYMTFKNKRVFTKISWEIISFIPFILHLSI